MLEELKGARVLDGVRGAPPVDRKAVAELVAAASRLGAAAGPRLRELDLNPVLAGPEGAVAVDWLLVLERTPQCPKSRPSRPTPPPPPRPSTSTPTSPGSAPSWTSA